MACTPFEENNPRGFTLLELVAVVAIAMLIAFFIFRMANSVQGREKLSGTRGRMEMVTAKIKQYYSAHEQLPDVVGPSLNQVPVAPEALNLEQKYRLDEWGTSFVYDPGDVNNIQDVIGSNGVGYAASLTSAGPDQLIDPPHDKDNLVVNIDLTQEASDIVLNKLKVLQEKVAAYDAMFASVDNDADGEIDEDPRAAAATTTNGACPPTGSFTNDPSEGLGTLDAIEQSDAYGCPAPLVDHIVRFYGLKSSIDPNTGAYVPGGYDRDPWMADPNDPNSHRPFAWGYPGRVSGDPAVQDRRDHRFYSIGPDGIDGPNPADNTDDDITYSAQ